MFPAHAGMNRNSEDLLDIVEFDVPRTRGDEPGKATRFGAYVPRTRGDEPMGPQDAGFDPAMFPAHAGMNRDRTTSDCENITRGDVPRTRGDEPT